MDLKRDEKVSLFDLALYFLKLGTTGFGGPIALTSSMQSDLVDKRGWFTQETFKEGMTLCQLAPGPLAAQMAIYFGWAHSGVLGATLVGLTFVLPSFLMVVAIAIFYIQFGDALLIQKLFRGVGPAVIAIICMGAQKLSRKNLSNNFLLWGIAIANATITIVTESEMIWVFIVCGLLALAMKFKAKRSLNSVILAPFLLTGIHGPATSETLKSIFLFFLKSGTFVFGSGLAIVPFLHGGVVVENQWLTEKQFLDAVAVAMITPGPVVITVGFIGFLVAGLAGASVAALGTFLPCYLFTVIPAPYFSKIAKNSYIREFVSGVTASAIGAIIGAVFILGRKSLLDVPTVAIFLIVLFGLLYAKKIPEPIWILLAAGAGLLTAQL
jgi:chromate transporter